MSENSEISSDSKFASTKALLEFSAPAQDLEGHRKAYEGQVVKGNVDYQTKFQYACCLVHSKQSDVKQAVPLLKELFQDGNEQMKRDSLFFLALAETKLKEYLTAMKYVKAFLSIEPSNHQAQQLEQYISSRLVKDGLTGMAITGVVAVAGGIAAIVVGGLVISTGVGLAVVKAFKSFKK